MRTTPWPIVSYGPICQLIPDDATEVTEDATPGCRVELSDYAWNRVVEHLDCDDLEFSFSVSTCGLESPVVVFAIAAPGSLSLIALDPTDLQTRALMQRNQQCGAIAIGFTKESDRSQSLITLTRHEALFARSLEQTEFLPVTGTAQFLDAAASVLSGCLLRSAMGSALRGVEEETFMQICIPNAEF